MDGPVLKVGVGLIEQMSAVEAELLQQGFNRVPAGIDPSNLVAKQYAKREVVADGDIPQKPITSVILMWRE